MDKIMVGGLVKNIVCYVKFLEVDHHTGIIWEIFLFLGNEHWNI